MKDLIILGTGPSGLSASIYASRYRIDHLVIGAELGGYLNEIHKIENYPGFDSISGAELSNRMIEHAKSSGSQIVQETVMDIKRKKGHFEITTDKNKYLSRSLIYSIGTQCKKLNIPGEKDLLGKGVSYCATCDGPFFKGKNVIVVGGANSAAMAALLLAEHAKKVTIIYRKKQMRCAPSYLEKIEKNPKIDIYYNTTLKKIQGDTRVENAILCSPPKPDRTFEVDGVFIEIGSSPNCDIIARIGVETNKKGFIVTNSDQSTSVDGVFAAGDITTNSNSFRQIVTATAEGAIAALSVFAQLKNSKKND